MKQKNRAKEQEPVPTIKTTHLLYILAAITIIGAAIRFYNIGSTSLWLDEAVTYLHSSLSFESIWSGMTSGLDYNPPLFFVFEWLVIKTFGNLDFWVKVNLEFWMRSVSAVFGILSIPAMYLLGKEFYDEYAGLVAASVVAFAPFLIYYSREARPYAMLLFFCIVATYFFVIAMKENTYKNWLYFSIASVLIVYTHFYGVIYLFALVLYSAMKYYKNPKSLLLSVVTTLLLTLPIIVTTYFLYLKRTATAPTYGYSGARLVTELLVQIPSLDQAIFIVIPITLLFIIGLVWLFLKNRDKYALLIWIVVVTVIVSMFAATKIPMIPRYAIFLIIPFALGVSAAYFPLSRLLKGGNGMATVSIVLVILMGVLVVPFCSTYYNSPGDDWRGVANELSRVVKEGDVVVPVPEYMKFPLDFYYNASSRGVIETNLSDSMKYEARNYTIYYIITPDIVAADPSGADLHWLQGYSTLVKQFGSIYITKGV